MARNPTESFNQKAVAAERKKDLDNRRKGVDFERRAAA
jgi:hypothetical protein